MRGAEEALRQFGGLSEPANEPLPRKRGTPTRYLEFARFLGFIDNKPSERRWGSPYVNCYETTFCGLPLMKARTFSTATRINRARAARVAHAMCGVMKQ